MYQSGSKRRKGKIAIYQFYFSSISFHFEDSCLHCKIQQFDRAIFVKTGYRGNYLCITDPRAEFNPSLFCLGLEIFQEGKSKNFWLQKNKISLN